jgi:cell division control protein 6
MVDTPESEHGEDSGTGSEGDASVLDNNRENGSKSVDMSIFDKYGEGEIFDDPDTLRDSYTPEEVNFRDDQEARLYQRLKGLIEGSSPKNAFLEGPNGTGKTLMTKRMTRTFQHHPDVDDLRVVTVNCSQCTSEVDVAKAAANQILPMGKEVPSSGLSSTAYLKRLFDAIDDISESTLLLVLDDVTRVDSLNTILYEVSREGHEGTMLNETDVAVFVTANEMSFYENLREDVYSSLKGKAIIEFDQYEQHELRQILQQRANIAFVDGAISEGEIRYAASLAAKKQGDARYGLDILEEAGERAELENATTVTDDHIEVAREEIDRARLSSKMMEYGIRTELLIATIAMLDMKDDLVDSTTTNQPVTTTAIQTFHEELCNSFGMSSYAENTYYKKFPSLVRHGLIRTQRLRDAPAKTYETVYPTERYIEVLSDELKTQLFNSEYGVLDADDFDNISTDPI